MPVAIALDADVPIVLTKPSGTNELAVRSRPTAAKMSGLILPFGAGPKLLN
jgi:hypothetical protein